MPRFLSLAKIIIKNNGSSLLQTNKSSKKGNTILIILIITFVLFIFSIFTSFYSTFMLGTMDINGNIMPADMDYLQNVLTLFIPYIFLFLFIFLNTIVISTFFLSTDSDTFLHLPFKPYEIFLAKLIYVVFFSYFIESLFLLPMNIAYIAVAGLNIFSIINQIVYFIAFPLIPISIIFLYSFIFSKIINFQKRRDIAVLVLSIVSVIGILIVQTSFTSFFNIDIDSISGDELLNLKILIAESVSNIKTIRPLLEFLSSGYTNNNITSLLSSFLFLIISVFLIVICSFIANKFYQKQLLNEKEDFKSRKKKNPLEIKITSPSKSYALKEWRMLYRSPNLLIQTIFPPLILIVILGLTFGVLYQDPAAASDFNEWYKIIQNVFISYPATLPFAALALATFTCSTVMISSSSFSREGKNISLLKHIPLDPIKQVRIKMLPGVIVSSIIALFVITCSTIIFKLNILLVIISSIVCILMIIVSNYIMVILDLKNPFLDWSNEVAAIKQNKIVLLSMLILFAITGISVGLVFIVMHFNIPFILIIIPSIAILSGVIALFELHLHKKRHSLFEHLE